MQGLFEFTNLMVQIPGFFRPPETSELHQCKPHPVIGMVDTFFTEIKLCQN